jgi:hypothetical protein
LLIFCYLTFFFSIFLTHTHTLARLLARSGHSTARRSCR